MTQATRPQKTPTHIQIQLLREGIVESVHHAEAVICDSRGRVLSVAGNAETGTFMRSALKPFQALAITATGVLERFDLGDRDLAIMCSSHRGTMKQVRQVFNILWRADIEPSYLQCPAAGNEQSPLKYNCSGKHAGMLAACQQHSWPLGTYLDRNHPVQQLILKKLAELLSMPADEFICARDDCGAPTYYMQLAQMASLFAKLASGNNLAMERITRAMTSYPEMIAGRDTFDTDLMQITDGAIISKAGAEGIQCIGKVGEDLGLAIKVRDGAKRAKYALAVYLLKQLGWISPDKAETLAETYMNLSNFKRLDVVGELSLF
ncbi:MAG: asparaginase [Cyanobacteria bacterium P01_H01_bin.119]